MADMADKWRIKLGGIDDMTNQISAVNPYKNRREK